MICKNCEYFKKIATQNMGICTIQETFFLISDNNKECHFLKVEELVCGDCVNYGEDCCLTQTYEDKVDGCVGFQYKNIIDIYTILFELIIRGEDLDEITQEIVKKMKESNLYNFIIKERSK